jgi:transposase
VTSLDRIQDLDQLRQVAHLLVHENARLHQRLTALLQENARLRGVGAREQLTLEIQRLQEQMAGLQRRLFAASSEKRPAAPAADPAAASESPAPARGHGPRPQHLPLRQVDWTLPEGARRCPTCAGDLSAMRDQHEESEEITVVQRQFVLLTHRRQKYRCRCEATVVTAPGPPKLIPGGRYSIDFAVEVAASKYLEHLPLERQVRSMTREGLQIDSQTLWDQLDALASHHQGNYEALGQRLLTAPVVHADETWWPLLDRRPSKRWWVWSVASEHGVVYRIQPSRSTEAGAKLLGGYQGVVMADGYGVYAALARAAPGLSLAHCWSHVRRKFIEVQDFYRGPCDEMLSLLGELFAIERGQPALRHVSDAARAEALRVIGEVRATQSRPIVARIRDWAYAQRCTPESGLRKAIDYMLGLWAGLTRFLDDPRIPLTNNFAERELRTVVVGRKNHYGSKSRRGTEVAAILYSLLETAQLIGVEPKAYLIEATRRVIQQPDVIFLPHALLT